MIKRARKNFGFIFPSTYDISMGGMTIAVLAEIVNSIDNWQFERFIVPWNPFMESKSVEHNFTLNEVDVIGFTTQFEVTYLALGWFLKRAKIPISNIKRKKLKGKYPPILIGGPCSFANPFPLIDIADGYFLGDAEASLPKFLRKIDSEGVKSFWNDPRRYMDINGFWSPHFLNLGNRDAYSELFKNKKFEEVGGDWYSRADFVDLNEVNYPLKQIVTELPNYHPYAPYKGKSFQLEIGRGCDHGCRFCMISKLFQRGRFRSYRNVLEILEEGMRETKVNVIDVFGTNLSEFPKLNELCWDIVNQGYEISLATLRPDKVNSDLIEALQEGGQRSITIATETGSEQLRKAIGKPMGDDVIYQAVETIGEAKIPSIKNFFLIGLPSETQQDRDSLLKMISKEYYIFSNCEIDHPTIKVDVNPFVPKWQTAFKNYLFYYLPENRNNFKQLISNLYDKLNRMPGIRPKQTPLIYSLAQTWITHLNEPINRILKEVPYNSNVYSTIYAPFFIYRYKQELDTLIKKIWHKFSHNDWKVEHQIKSTHHSDEFFTKEYQKLMRN